MGAGRGPRAARAEPRSTGNGSSSCTAPPTRDPAAGSRCPATGRQPAVARSPRARTTTPPRERGGSRRGSDLTKRREVTPLVRLADGLAIVGRIGGVHFGGAMAGEKRVQRFIDQCGISDARAHPPGVFEQPRVDRRAQSCASHATSMPQRCRESVRMHRRCATYSSRARDAAHTCVRCEQVPTRRPDHRQDDASTREGEPAAGLTPPQGASAQILALQSSFGNAAVARAIAAGQLGVAREGAGAVDAAWGYEAGEASEDRGEAENEDPEARLARAVAARIAEKGKAAEKPPAPPAWGYTAASEEGEQESAPPAWGYTPASEEGEQESAPPAWGYTPASEEGEQESAPPAWGYTAASEEGEQESAPPAWGYTPASEEGDSKDQAAAPLYEPYNVSEDQAAPLYEPYNVSEDQAASHYEPYVVSEDQAPLYEPYVGSEDQASEPASAGPAGPAPAAAPPTMMSKAKRALKALGKPFTALGAAIKSAFKGMRGQKKGATPTPAEQLRDPGAAAPGKYYGSPYSPYGAGEKAGPHPLAGGMSEISAASAPAAKKYANLAPMLMSPAEKDSSADFLNDGLLASNSLALDMFRHGLAQRSEIAALQKDPDRVREGLKRVGGWSDEDVLKCYDASSNKAKGTKGDYIASEQDL